MKGGMQTEKHKHPAIVCDLVGYSRFWQCEESVFCSRFRLLFQIIPSVMKHVRIKPESGSVSGPGGHSHQERLKPVPFKEISALKGIHSQRWSKSMWSFCSLLVKLDMRFCSLDQLNNALQPSCPWKLQPQIKTDCQPLPSFCSYSF